MLVVISYPMNEILSITRHIENFTFVFEWYKYDLLYWRYEVMNGRQKVLFFGGKQL